MNHWEEEAARRHDLELNYRMSDGKWRSPIYRNNETKEIDITQQIREIENWIINKHGRIIGKVDEVLGEYKRIS